MAYKTPGVYVEEISLFPPSVAEVATAVPAFIGYTEKAEKKGADLTNIPTKIKSLLEYKSYFGGGFDIDEVEVVVDPDNGYAVQSVTPDAQFYMYDALKLFFDNGGGNCYIVSVNPYVDSAGDPVDVELGDAIAGDPGLRIGLDALEKFDEPTIILFPDAPRLAQEAQFYSLQQAALAQCNKLQDRVCVFDLHEFGDFQTAVDNFRNSIGINNLKYGAAYTPWLNSSYTPDVDFSIFNTTVEDLGGAGVNLGSVTADSKLNAMVTEAVTALTDDDAIEARLVTLRSGEPSLSDRYTTLRRALVSTDDAGAPGAFDALFTFVRGIATDITNWPGDISGTNLTRDLTAYAQGKLGPAVENLIRLETVADVQTLDGDADPTNYAAYETLGWLSDTIANIAAGATDYDYDDGGALLAHATALNILGGTDPTDPTASALSLDTIFEDILAFIGDMTDAAETHRELSQQTLYENHSIIGNIVESIKSELSRIPPSGAVAGLYAYVDRTRGVWKAPANVSVSSVTGPSVPIDFFDQEDLNVDVTGGKSINAIRTFTGRGTIVWGARTLAGNDNEWRYVPVRRFFNMVEESVKKSTAWAVFEPNSAPLWTKVKSMIENYLIQKWREGALAGSTPEAAFFVRVGLGETMTAQDILEGRLIVEIGMAVVRPAEFIILKFSHKMQEA